MYADDANLSCYNSDVNVIQTNLEYDMAPNSALVC